MKKHAKMLLALLAAAMMLLTACGGGAGQPGGTTAGSGAATTSGGDTTAGGTGVSTKDTLRVAIAANPTGLDPQLTSNLGANRVMKLLYNTLVYQDNDLTLTAGLAESWEYVDNMTLNMKLRQGVKFHNGEEMKASDVKFSLERARGSAQVGFIIDMLEEVEIHGDYEITLKLNTPYAMMLEHLAHNGCSIVSEKAVREKGDDINQDPIGTGPFKLVNWVAGDQLELERFEDYYEGPVPLKKMVLRVITEGANRSIEIETGGVDLAYEIPPEDISKIDAAAGMHIVRDLNLTSTYIGFNNQKAPFDDVRVRQAISYAINRDAMVESVFGSVGKVSNGPITEMVWSSIQSELEPYAYNVEKAQELMREAGLEDGFSLQILTTDNSQRRDIAELVQNQLKAINIEAEVLVMQNAPYHEHINSGQHDMVVSGWTCGTADPDYGMYSVLHSGNHQSSANLAFYTNAEVDRLLEEGRATIDREKSAEIYAQIQRIVRDDAPWVFLHQGESVTAITDDIRGFANHPNTSHRLFTIYFE